jgi:hypothetical protein
MRDHLNLCLNHLRVKRFRCALPLRWLMPCNAESDHCTSLHWEIGKISDNIRKWQYSGSRAFSRTCSSLQETRGTCAFVFYRDRDSWDHIYKSEGSNVYVSCSECHILQLQATLRVWGHGGYRPGGILWSRNMNCLYRRPGCCHCPRYIWL